MGIKRLGRGVVIYDGEVVQTGKWRETPERFFPKLGVRFDDLRPNGQ